MPVSGRGGVLALLKECKRCECSSTLSGWEWLTLGWETGKTPGFDHTVSRFSHSYTQRNPCLSLQRAMSEVGPQPTRRPLSVIYSGGRTLSYVTASLEVRAVVLGSPPSRRPGAQKPPVRMGRQTCRLNSLATDNRESYLLLLPPTPSIWTIHKCNSGITAFSCLSCKPRAPEGCRCLELNNLSPEWRISLLLCHLLSAAAGSS